MKKEDNVVTTISGKAAFFNEAKAAAKLMDLTFSQLVRAAVRSYIDEKASSFFSKRLASTRQSPKNNM